MTNLGANILGGLLGLALVWPAGAVGPTAPLVQLRASLQPSAVRTVSAGTVEIVGTAALTNDGPVRVRVTTSLGQSFVSDASVRAGRFTCRFPHDFRGAPALAPMVLYVDATAAREFGGTNVLTHQTEALLVVSGTNGAWPDLPLAFTDDFIDAQGRRDRESAQYASQRVLVNQFMRGRAAKLMRIQQSDFDLTKAEDWAWFQNRASLYDFDHRDRDWTQPLGSRVARGFWQAVWDTWFNPSNDHPWDGNPGNRNQSNYRPYIFANDSADLLVLYQMLRSAQPRVADNRDALINDVLANLLAMQHRGTNNFALRETTGKQEHYTAGAFRYGMFETGEWLTEGKGWFVNPKHRDFARGGVFNGRAVWALGESLKADRNGPHAAQVKEAIQLALKFCFHDGVQHGYTRRTKAGRRVWNTTAGEHAFLVRGMLAASEVTPDLPVKLAAAEPPRTLRELSLEALDALVETAGEDGTWSRYPNADAVNIAVLAEGARLFPNHQRASAWKQAAIRAADVWLALQPLPAERRAPTPHVGYRKGKNATFFLGEDRHAHIPLYIGGHWIHALAVLHQATGDARYGDRAHALFAYYCGDNPLHVRLLHEIGAINNRVSDMNGDGVEETLWWDGYPESTAFVQIGLLHLLGR